MFCQICNRQLAPVEPIYRLQLGASINHGWRASLCKSCLDHFGSTRLYRISSFREQNCEHCGRPVLTPSCWKPKRAICSAKCRSALETKEPNNFEPGADPNGNAGIAARNSHQNALINVTARWPANRLPTVVECAYRQTDLLRFRLRACQNPLPGWVGGDRL